MIEYPRCSGTRIWLLSRLWLQALRALRRAALHASTRLSASALPAALPRVAVLCIQASDTSTHVECLACIAHHPRSHLLLAGIGRMERQTRGRVPVGSRTTTAVRRSKPTERQDGSLRMPPQQGFLGRQAQPVRRAQPVRWAQLVRESKRPTQAMQTRLIPQPFVPAVWVCGYSFDLLLRRTERPDWPYWTGRRCR